MEANFPMLDVTFKGLYSQKYAYKETISQTKVLNFGIDVNFYRPANSELDEYFLALDD